jgi:hypothetical protein
MIGIGVGCSLHQSGWAAFNFWDGQDCIFWSRTPRPALKPDQPPTKWIAEGSFPMGVTTHFHLLVRLILVELYSHLHLPDPKMLHLCLSHMRISYLLSKSACGTNMIMTVLMVSKAFVSCRFLVLNAHTLTTVGA